jgi:hypothetical protein
MELARLIDASPEGLTTRLAALTARLTGPYVVSRHTYWFTNRPPVHEAVVHEPHAPARPAGDEAPHPGSMAA